MRFLFFFVLTTQTLFSQQLKQLSASEILNNIQKLNKVGSVLYIAAHPDDENTRLISYLVNERHIRTGYLSITRGDGGQNLIGTEQGAGLGVIRTQELLAARRIDGAEQFFTRANDFGFSKTPDETLKLWNHDQVLSDMVQVIRQFNPDIIICRFPTTGEGGHGHHTASAILAEEAFEAAADPNRFPEQLKLVSTWQTKRLFWNTFNFGGNNTTSEDQLKLDVGGFQPLLGLSNGEIASRSRTMHKSQGFGTAMQRGENWEYFKLIKGDFSPKMDLFEGLDVSWKRFGNSTYLLTSMIAECESNFDEQHPSKSVSKLISIYKELNQLSTSNDPILVQWSSLKMELCKQLILQCAGIWMESTTTTYSTSPGSEISIKTQLLVRNPIQVTVRSVRVAEVDERKMDEKLAIDQMKTFEFDYIVPKDAVFSSPYWLNKPYTFNMYTVDSLPLIGKAENSPAVQTELELEIEGLNLLYFTPVVYKHTDPVKGEVYRPLEILPAITIAASTDLMYFNDFKTKTITFTVQANQDNCAGKLVINTPKGWEIDIPNANFNLSKKGDEAKLVAYFKPSNNAVNGEVRLAAEFENQLFSQSISRIEYDHIPYQFYLSNAGIKLVHLNLVTVKKSIGYIPGAGDKVAEYLTQIGYQVTTLTNEKLEQEDLSKYECIITGIRAYNVNEKLQFYYPKLMKYIESGGNLLVQYNTNNRLAPLEDKIGPYPFEITRNRVTEENASVTLNTSELPVFNLPNKITQHDFDDWVQERGVYFADKLDNHYETVMQMNDSNEKPLNGSLIIGKYGKGHFVYTGISFFRQIPAGVNGAMRLLVNLIELK